MFVILNQVQGNAPLMVNMDRIETVRPCSNGCVRLTIGGHEFQVRGRAWHELEILLQARYPAQMGVLPESETVV